MKSDSKIGSLPTGMNCWC